MTWTELKAEVDRQIEEQKIGEGVCLLQIEIYPVDGVTVALSRNGTVSIE